MPTFALQHRYSPIYSHKVTECKKCTYENGCLFPVSGLLPAGFSKNRERKSAAFSILPIQTRISQAQNQQKSEKSSSSIECIFKGQCCDINSYMTWCLYVMFICLSSSLFSRIRWNSASHSSIIFAFVDSRTMETIKIWSNFYKQRKLNIEVNDRYFNLLYSLLLSADKMVRLNASEL